MKQCKTAASGGRFALAGCTIDPRDLRWDAASARNPLNASLCLSQARRAARSSRSKATVQVSRNHLSNRTWASLGRFHLKRADEPPRTPGSRSKIPSQPGHCGGPRAFRAPSGRASQPAGGAAARRPVLLPAGACDRLQSRRHLAPARSIVVRRRTIRSRAGMAHARHPPGSQAGISGKPWQHAAAAGTA